MASLRQTIVQHSSAAIILDAPKRQHDERFSVEFDRIDRSRTEPEQYASLSHEWVITLTLSYLASVSHPLSLSDTSSSDVTSTTTDEGYDAASVASSATVIHGACLTLSDHDRIHVFMWVINAPSLDVRATGPVLSLIE